MKVVYYLTRQKRSLAASIIVFSTQHVTLRLVWALTHYKQVQLVRSSEKLNLVQWKLDTMSLESKPFQLLASLLPGSPSSG